MPWPQRLNDDKGHIVPNSSDSVRRPMMMFDYAQLFVKPGARRPAASVRLVS